MVIFRVFPCVPWGKKDLLNRRETAKLKTFIFRTPIEDDRI